MVQFTQRMFTVSENEEYLIVNIQSVGGVAASPFNVTIVPSEQSPVSAQGVATLCYS